MTDYTGRENLEAMKLAVNYNNFLLSLVLSQARQSESIVDLGAGLGAFAVQLRTRGFEVVCVEPDAVQAGRIAALGLPVARSLADLADGTIDLLYSLNVLEHVEDDGAILRECLAKLRIGGRILVYVPALPLLYSSMDRLVGHHRRYLRSQLEQRVSEAGFELLECRYADCAGILASLAFKALGRRDGSVGLRSLRAYDKYVFPLSRAGDRVFGRLGGKNLYVLAVRLS
jgi:SAM-dependent methyltransferase